MTFRLFRRTLPPAAAPIFPGDLMHGVAGAMFAKRYLEKIETEMKAYFGVKHLFFVSSESRLTLILTALKSLSSRRRVGIPAYTCFSVPRPWSRPDWILPGRRGSGDWISITTNSNSALMIGPSASFPLTCWSPSDIDRVRGSVNETGVCRRGCGPGDGGEYKEEIGHVGGRLIFSFGRESRSTVDRAASS
jgi:hypothetical protein